MKQLLVFFGLACFISWTIWLPLYGHIFGLTNLPVLPFNHAIGGFGPFIASFLTTIIFLKTDGVKKLFRKCIQLKPFLYLIVALVSPFVLACIALLANHYFNHTPFDIFELFTSKEFPHWNFLAFFIYNLVFFGFGEEAGWRGFALPRLLNKVNALSASILLTLLWASWHLPLFYYRPGYTTMEWTGILGWIFSLLTGSILLTWLYKSSRGSIFICAIFHTTVDIAFTADFSDKNISNYMGFLITVWGILTVIIFKPKNLVLIS